MWLQDRRLQDNRLQLDGIWCSEGLQGSYLLQLSFVVFKCSWAVKPLFGVVADGHQLPAVGWLQGFCVGVCLALWRVKVYHCLWGIWIIMFGSMFSLVVWWCSYMVLLHALLWCLLCRSWSWYGWEIKLLGLGTALTGDRHCVCSHDYFFVWLSSWLASCRHLYSLQGERAGM